MQPRSQIAVHNKHRILGLLVGIFLLTAASRLIHIASIPMNWDDIWSVWQTLGSPIDVLHWTPLDWPPLFFLSLWGWKELTGITPEALRVFSVLISLLGSACFYRVTRRIWNEAVALIATLAFGALAYDIFLSVLVRGYIVELALTPLTLWFTIRYFDHPTVRRAVLLSLCLLAQFFTHYTSIFAFLLIGMYTLLVYRKAVWRWWLPLLMSAPLLVLQVLSNLQIFGTHLSFTRTMHIPPLPTAFYDLLNVFTGPPFIIWAALLLIATILLVRHIEVRTLVLVAWVALLLPIYIFHNRLGLFQDSRYLWWVIPGIIWWLGWGVSRLPQPAATIAAFGLIIAMFWPGNIGNFQQMLYSNVIPMDKYMQALRQEMQPGDTLLVDKNNECGPNESWDYFMRVYFPDGLQFVTSPQNYRRVWYVSTPKKKVDSETLNAVNREHMPTKFIGNADCQIQLYESPPDPQGILFANGMRFHGAELSGLTVPNGKLYHEGEKIHLRLWWSIDTPVKLDYSVGVYAITPQGIGQVDGAPNVDGAPHETSRWVAGRYYIDERDVQLPYPLDDGTYPIYLSIYQWWDNQRISAPGLNKDSLLPLQNVIVHAW